ncbi:MAG: choice-of-anchor J domain-containing protein [Bacteroidetes bacterium]|nr:choice-of-anchor J domain-containing protein [Bacteroidota bacterium]
MMKKSTLYLFVLVVLASNFSIAQTWREDMQIDGANFYDIQKKYAKEFKKAEKEMRKNVRRGKKENEEQDGEYQMYKRWENFIEPRVAPTGELPNPMIAYLEMNDFNKRYPATSYKTLGNWTALGPFVRNAQNNVHGLGRINSTTVDPTNPNKIYVASASGGIWSTSDGGATWANNTDELPVLGFTNIVIDPQNTNILYASSGDGDAGDTYGLGVLKSTDGGQSWNTTGLNFLNSNSRIVRKVIMNPNNSNELMAATNVGLYKTTDAAVTWVELRKGNYSDIEYKPGDPNTVYIVSTLFLKSIDGGLTFSVITNGVPASNNVRRLSIAVTPANPDYVYLIAGEAGTNVFEGLYRSSDAGNTFITRSTSPNIMGVNVNGSDTYGQAWYTLPLCVSPTDAELVFCGGLNIWKSTNGGATLTCAANWLGSNGLPYVHGDIHALEYFNGVLYSSDDGGLFTSTDDGASFTDMSSGIVISQFYRLACSQINTDLILTGAQDNSSAMRKNNEWNEIRGGDGMEQLVHVNNPNTLFSASQFGSIGRSTNGGLSFNNILGGLNGTGDWVTPFTMTPGGTFYVAYKDVYRSTNNGGTVTKISNFGVNNFNVLAVSNTDSNYIYCGVGSQLNRTSDGGVSWINVGANIPTGGLTLTYLAFDAVNPMRAWVTCSGFIKGNKVFETNDAGLTWTNISLNLPNLPVNCIAYEAGSNDGLYIGTDVGIYYKNNSMKAWQPFMAGLPNVIVRELEIVYPINKIRAATYGRGIWESDLYNVAPPVVDFISTRKKICVGQSVTFYDASTEGPTSRSWIFIGGTPATSTADSVTVTYTNAGSYDVTLSAANSAGTNTLTKTVYVEVTNNVAPLPFSETFEGTTLLPAGWEMINYDNDFTWQQTTAAGGFGLSAKSILYKNFGNFNSGLKDDIFTINYDFSALTTGELSFDVAYARLLPNLSDSLVVYASEDCGQTFAKIYNKGGSGLKTIAGYVTTNFVPAATEWRKEVININQYAGKPQVMYKFVASSAGGNNLYLDNINISEITGLGINQNSSVQSATISPNPVTDILSLHYDKNNIKGNVTVAIYDSEGRAYMVNAIPDGESNIDLDCSPLNAGIYIAKLSNNGIFHSAYKFTKL